VPSRLRHAPAGSQTPQVRNSTCGVFCFLSHRASAGVLAVSTVGLHFYHTHTKNAASTLVAAVSAASHGANSLVASRANLCARLADTVGAAQCYNARSPEPFSAMNVDSMKLPGLDDVRKFVQQSICDQHGLEVTSAPMSERALLRGSRTCGIFFCVQGPRNVRFTAIWDQEKNAVLFYDSSGERLRRTMLSARASI
jgi:hypothetical protein